MIDLEKEEFLQRLDVRLSAMASMLAIHESYIAATTCDIKQFRETQRSIEQMRVELLEFISKTDNQIQAEFERIKKKNNGGNTMNIVKELRTKKSRDNRELLDRAADRIEELEREKVQIFDDFDRLLFANQIGTVAGAYYRKELKDSLDILKRFYTEREGKK